MTLAEKLSLGRYAVGKTSHACSQIAEGQFEQAADTLQQLAAILRSHHENQLIIKNRLVS